MSYGKVVDGIGWYTIGDGSKRWRVVYSVGRAVRTKGGFQTKAAAQHWQRHTLVDRDNGTLMDDKKARTTFDTFAAKWLDTKEVRAKTEDLYRYEYRVHIKPTFGEMQFRHIDAEAVRQWHTKLKGTNRKGSKHKLSQATVAKVYRLLRQMCEYATEDGYFRTNPCRIKKASREPVIERDPMTPAQVRALAAAVPARYRAMILLAGFGGLRYGELAGLQRKHVDLAAGAVRVEQQLTDIGGKRSITKPKTDAGIRTVYVHSEVTQALREHLAAHVEAWSGAHVFTVDTGEWLQPDNFRRRVWIPATVKAGCVGYRFHDLRHTAATLAAQTGATIKDLMARMGHASTEAALRYQHAVQDKQQAIASAMEEMLMPQDNVVPLRAEGS
jgi:integrase